MQQVYTTVQVGNNGSVQAGIANVYYTAMFVAANGNRAFTDFCANTPAQALRKAEKLAQPKNWRAGAGITLVGVAPFATQAAPTVSWHPMYNPATRSCTGYATGLQVPC